MGKISKNDSGTNLYNNLICITADYLGPASSRFIDRQIRHHLGKSTQNITAADVDRLKDWLKVSFALLTEDSKLVSAYADRLNNLAAANDKQVRHGKK